MRATMRSVSARRGLARASHAGARVVPRGAGHSAVRREHSAAAAQRDLQSLTVPQLKEIIRNSNVNTEGGLLQKRKSELIEAILEHGTKDGTLRPPRGAPALHTGSGELAPRPALGEPVVAELPASVRGKVRTDTPDVVAALSTLSRGNRPQTTAPAAPVAPREGPRVPQLVEPTAAVLEAPRLINEALAEAPVVIFSKTFCPHCKEVVTLLDKLGLTQAPHVVELDLLQPERMNAMQDHLKELTGARSVPRVFIGSKFIGGADVTIAAHTSGKLAEVLVKAGALPKPVPAPAPALAPAASPAAAAASPAPAAPAAKPPQPTSGLLQGLAALPTRADRTIELAGAPRTTPRSARPAPALHEGAGELAPVQDSSIIAAPKGPRYSPVSARSKVDVVKQLQKTTRSQVVVTPKTPAEVEVAKMENSVKAALPSKTTAPKASSSVGGGNAAAPSKAAPKETAPKASSSTGGSSGGTRAGGTGSAVVSGPQMAGATAAAWLLGLVSIYLNKPKTEDMPPASTVVPMSQVLKNVSPAELGAAGEEEMAAVVRIMQRLDRIENEVTSMARPNPRRDALLKAKQLQIDAGGAGNARDPDRMKRLQATAADLREACTAQGAGAEAMIRAKVVEVDTAEKIEAAAVGMSLGVAGGVLVYGLMGGFSRR